MNKHLPVLITLLTFGSFGAFADVQGLKCHGIEEENKFNTENIFGIDIEEKKVYKYRRYYDISKNQLVAYEAKVTEGQIHIRDDWEEWIFDRVSLKATWGWGHRNGVPYSDRSIFQCEKYDYNKEIELYQKELEEIKSKRQL